MKKIISIILLMINIIPVFAKTDRLEAEYLKNKKHFSMLNPLAESAAEKIIEKSLKKKIGSGKYKAKFSAYTLSSMKKGIFKTIEIQGKDLEIDSIPIPYLNVKSVSDYNWIDITQNPVIVKTDMELVYQLGLNETSINAALKQKDYQKFLDKLNKRAYPLFEMHNVQVRIKNNRAYIIMDYTLPLANSKKVKTFMVSSKFQAENGCIKPDNINIDKTYGNLQLDKVINLINLINPLSFTISQLKENNCQGRVESVNIVDNIVQVNGRIFVEKYKGE